jgi:hypothetical protein
LSSGKVVFSHNLLAAGVLDLIVSTDEENGLGIGAIIDNTLDALAVAIINKGRSQGGSGHTPKFDRRSRSPPMADNTVTFSAYNPSQDASDSLPG